MTPKEARLLARTTLAELHAEQREAKKLMRQPHTPETSYVMGTAHHRAALITGWSNKLNELCGRAPCHGANPGILFWWGEPRAEALRSLVIEIPEPA